MDEEEHSPEIEIEADEKLSLEEQLLLLQMEHRELDEHIVELLGYVYRNQLEIQRLKKKKLRLKDSIGFLKDQIIPDWNA